MVDVGCQESHDHQLELDTSKIALLTCTIPSKFGRLRFVDVTSGKSRRLDSRRTDSGFGPTRTPGPNHYPLEYDTTDPSVHYLLNDCIQQ
jgi:hypothetical protein